MNRRSRTYYVAETFRSSWAHVSPAYIRIRPCRSYINIDFKITFFIKKTYLHRYIYTIQIHTFKDF